MMNIAEYKEQILALMSSLKLTEKNILLLEDEELKWKNRLNLAREQGMEDLTGEAARELERSSLKLAACRGDAREIKGEIDNLRRQLPAIAARERSIDPDLLEQELEMLLGNLGRPEEELRAERAFQELEKETAANEALEALKAKIVNKNTNNDGEIS